jgi:NAD(P)-dependent dehydrogenase (short-subunit alcohol dehydrogenase family)
MKQVSGKVAVVTGAASGIGRGMAEAFVDAGMKLVAADIDEAALAATAHELRAAGGDVHTVRTDVSKYEQIVRLADEAEARFGKVHVLCNNAGIGLNSGAASWDNTSDDWQWILQVNLLSVIHAHRVFLPRMLRHGEEGHIVNTASMAGLLTGADTMYGMTKAAVVRLSEGTYLELQRRSAKISVSVLCPGFVSTNIQQSELHRPADWSEKTPVAQHPAFDAYRNLFADLIKGGMPPRAVADLVLEAIREQRFYILTHPEWTQFVEHRAQRIVAGEPPANPPLFSGSSFEELLKKHGLKT